MARVWAIHESDSHELVALAGLVSSGQVEFAPVGVDSTLIVRQLELVVNGYEFVDEADLNSLISNFQCHVGTFVDIPGSMSAVLRERSADAIKALTQKYAKMEEPATAAEVSDEAAPTPQAKPVKAERARLTREQVAKLAQMEPFLNSRCFGQEAAVKVVCKKLKRSLLGLKAENKPDCVLIFAGPSGVGKTELAKALAEFMGWLYGADYPFKTVDMTQYMERHTASRFIGAPAGYIGYNEGGEIVNAIASSPNCLILLDELGRAHPTPVGLLMRPWDEGTITDAKGQEIDARGVIWIGTGNYGSSDVKVGQPKIGFTNETVTSADFAPVVDKELRGQMKPEQLNRVNAVIIFDAITDENLEKIARGKLAQAAARIASGVELTFSEPAVKFLMEIDRDPQQGARHLDRVIEDYIDPLLVEYLEEAGGIDAIEPGRAIKVVLRNGELELAAARPTVDRAATGRRSAAPRVTGRAAQAESYLS